MSVIKLKPKSQVTIPDGMRRELGVEVGDLLEARVQKGSIVLKPHMVADRDGHTPRQRRRIDAELAKSKAEYKEGKSYGPFQTADEMIAHMKGQLKKRAAAKKAKRSR